MIIKLIAAMVIATLVNIVWMLAIALPAHPAGTMPTPLPLQATRAQSQRHSIRVDRARVLNADRQAVLYTALGIEVLVLAAAGLIYVVANVRRHHHSELARTKKTRSTEL